MQQVQLLRKCADLCCVRNNLDDGMRITFQKASAPIWGFPLTNPRLDGSAIAISRGMTAAGGATDTCFDNMNAAFPLIAEIGKTDSGRALLSQAFQTCNPLEENEIEKLIMYASEPWFYLAEGNYPFPSTYITFSLGIGLIPLPAWPMRVACSKGLNIDLGVVFKGDRAAVNYTVSIGNLTVNVDWGDTSSPSGDPLVFNSARADLDYRSANDTANITALVRGLGQAAGVWWNITGKLTCFDVKHANPRSALWATFNNGGSDGMETSAKSSKAADSRTLASPLSSSSSSSSSSFTSPSSPSSSRPTPPPTPPPPPPGPITIPTCTNHSAGSAWSGIGCNEHWNQVNTIIRGTGRDFFWPPSRIGEFGGLPWNWTYDAEVSRRWYSCRYGANDARGFPASRDAWSKWVDNYYGGLNIEAASNIVFSNGLLDPWSSGGVLQNISDSLVAVVLDLGAHHLDLMFSDPADPPCVKNARAVQEANILKWIKESRAYNTPSSTGSCSRHGCNSVLREH